MPDSDHRGAARTPGDGPRVGQRLELQLESLAYGGDTVARHDGVVVFVRRGAPGDRVRARIVERKKSFARAVIEAVVTPSPERREPACRHFGECGGCQLQFLSQPAQERAKVGFIRDALTRIAGIPWTTDIPLRTGPEYGWRMRSQMVRDAREGRHTRLGFLAENTHDLCEVTECPILVPALQQLLPGLRASTDWPQIRKLDLIAGEDGPTIEPELPGLPTGPRHQVVAGTRHTIRPSVFFQGNAFLLEALVAEALGNARGSHAVELYCGVGLFTAPLAARFGSVAAVESDPAAVALARQTLAQAGHSQATVDVADAKLWLRRYLRDGGPRPELLLLDPPREGAAALMPHIATLAPDRVHYVSCDPSTLARDLRALSAAGYRLESVVGLDLFPQTWHVETVCQLVRTGPIADLRT